MLVENAHEAFGLNDQVQAHGLRVIVDYNWRYDPAINNWLGDETLTEATVEFDFKDEQMVTYFKLKWTR